MTSCNKPVVFLCNKAAAPSEIKNSSRKILDYRTLGAEPPTVRLGLPDFIQQIYHLPDRCLDLLELAAYVFAADRLVSRGPKAAVEYHSWARRFQFVVKVRDCDFWCDSEVNDALRTFLCFATGDQDFEFIFQAGHITPPTSLFDDSKFTIGGHENIAIMPFSGGLDSLTGAIQRLNKTEEHICLVSHISQAGTIRTQRALVSALQNSFPDRISHYQFKTHLQTVRAREETQRSRIFLYGSIAFALATAFNQDSFYIYENGVTSLNFGRREDLINARASRTTHPQAIQRIAQLFSMVGERQFSIETPFLWCTKSDVINSLKSSGQGHLLPSSVSCSQTYNSGVHTTHCGECFQCLDRRFGIYGAACHELDNESLYATDVIVENFLSRAGKTIAVDYLRQAVNFATWNVERFYLETLDELRLLVGWVPELRDEVDLVEKIWHLYCRHAKGVKVALEHMRQAHEEIFSPLPAESLLRLVSEREFLRAPVERLANEIVGRLKVALPRFYQSAWPTNEQDLNDKIHGLLTAWQEDVLREHPAIPFASAGVRPDFSVSRSCLLVEGKYVRKHNTPSKITDGMAADLIKYPQEAHILFVVYDPSSAISERDHLVRDFEEKGRCTVCVLP